LDTSRPKISHGFVSDLKSIIRCLFRLVQAQPYDRATRNGENAPLSPSFWIAFGKLEVNQVLDLLVPHFLDEVQTILGNAEVTVNDLLMLPRQPKQILHGWLVYIDIFTGALDFSSDFKTTTELEVAEAGIYTGSAPGLGGGVPRWRQYDRVVPSVFPESESPKKSYHYRFDRMSGRTMNVRTVAISLSPLNTSFWSIFAEGLVTTLLGSLGDSGDRKRFVTSSMFKWYDKCSGVMTDLRINVKAEPLNHSWPLL